MPHYRPCFAEEFLAEARRLVLARTEASHLRAAAAGVSDRRLAELMGHTDPKMTHKYIHLANPDLRTAALEATKGYLRVKKNGDSSS
jgi:hypothetical protein